MLIKYNETGEIVTSWKYNKGNNVFEIFSNDKEKISEYDPVLVLGAGKKSKNWMDFSGTGPVIEGS